MRILTIAISSLLLLSCSAKKEYATVKSSSVFAKANELGANKTSFIAKYGEPINKDMKKEGTDIIESLYYLENIKGIMVTTKIKFVNDALVEQSNYKMDSSDKDLKELKEQMEFNDLRNYSNGLKIDSKIK